MLYGNTKQALLTEAERWSHVCIDSCVWCKCILMKYGIFLRITKMHIRKYAFFFYFVLFSPSSVITYPLLLFLDALSSPQIWVGCRGRSSECDGQLRSQVLVMDPETHTVAKELQAHSDIIKTLCSAEDRYVLSGSARRDGKIAIWKAE